jgi:uncharacterized protein (TIRG00374 family)
MDLQPEKKKVLNLVLTILRILVGLGLIVFLFVKLDVEKIFFHIKNMDIKYLVYALLPYLLFIIVSAWRWQVLLDHKNMELPFKDSLIIYFIALFFNNFLPTTVGGDVMRVIYLNRKTDALGIVIADRILGFIGLFIFGLFAVMYLYIFQKKTEFISLMIVGLAILILITFFLFSKRVYQTFGPIIKKLRVFRLGERISNLHKTMTKFGSAWGVIILCIIQSIIIQALLAISPYLVLQSMGKFQVTLLPFFIYLPIINVLSMIPVSFNALGVRENAYVFLFQRAGLSGEVSMTVSLVSFFLIFLWSLLGGVFFIFYKKPKNIGEGGL